MITRITPIRLNERSPAVANLQAGMQMLGLSVAAAELNAQQAGETTAQHVRDFQRRMNITPKEGFLIDDVTADAINNLLREQGVALADEGRACWVRGIVRGAGRNPVRDLVVTAFDQDLRKRQELGRCPTRNDGEYLIYYDRSKIGNAELGGADLVLQVSGPGGELLYTSAVQFNVAPTFNFDIQLSKGPTEAEFDRLLRLVQPLVAGQDVTLATLDESDKFTDISFIAGETGLDRARLTEFVVAQRLARDGLPAEFWFAGIRSGAVPQALPPATGWPSLDDAAKATLAKAVATAPSAVQAGLKEAVDHQIISAKAGGNIDAWMRSFRALVAAGTGASPTAALVTVQKALETAGLAADKRQAVLDAYVESGTRAEALDRLAKAHVLDARQLQAVGTHLALHDMTLGDAKLVGALVTNRVVDPQDPQALRKVARFGAGEWEQTIKQANVDAPAYMAGDTPDLKRASYAKLITMQFQRAYPTAAFAGSLERDLKAAPKPGPGGAAADARHRQAPNLLKFFDGNPDFELASMGVDKYLKEKAAPATAELARDPEFTTQLKATQRIYKIAPSYEATNALLADGLHSAQQVYRHGKQAFVARYESKPGFDETRAGETWERAANTHAAAMAIVGDLVATANANQVFALDSGSSALADFPNLTNLFGNGDACDCEECRSVFGAAAYLADQLMYLESRKAADGVMSVKSTLFDRRPDLGLIELTCANTNTTLPYVDLACEVLEDRVSPWKLFDLPAAQAAIFVHGPANAAVRAAFAGAAPPITLTAAAFVTGPDHLGGWVVRDTDKEGDHTWRVRPAGATLEVSILRQTRGTPEELAANPEYVNQNAYQQLAAAHYPMALPFDLATEEVDDYLAKITVKRSAIMEAFRGNNAPNNPTDLDIAAAYLGVTPSERPIIFVDDPVDTTQQFQYWGEASNAAAIAAMSRVDAFLLRTNLEYEQLQALLTLDFVNPNGTAVIRHLDESCDLSQKRIQPLDAALLDRIHRFLRLWRKLGWKMWEVDLVIRNAQVGKGKINNAFLLALYAFAQVRDKLGTLSVEQSSALFDRVNTKSKFVAQSAPPEPSLYEQLFLNKRVMDKLDPAFAIDTVTLADPAPPAVPPAAPDIAPDHLAPVLAATRASDADLALLLGLIRPVADPGYAARPAWIDGKMRLGNLSFVYRHSLLIRTLRIKAPDWARLLYLLQSNVFATPAALLDFLNRYDRIKAAGFSTDELGYVLSADLTAKPAETDKTISGTLTTLRKGLQSIAAAATAPVPTDVDGLIAFIGAELQALGWDTPRVTALATLLKPEARAAAVPDSFVFPAAIASAIPIAFNGETRALSFRGLMTDGQRTTLLNDASLAAVTGIADYQNAVAALFAAPRAAMKFYWPEFRTNLKTLPSDVQFSTQLEIDLAAKVSYDAERQQLVFFGVMTAAERDTLKGLSVDAAYTAAVQSLFDQPGAVAAGDVRLWVQPADDLGTAATKLVAYAAATLSRNLVIQQFATALRITPAVSEQLLTNSKLFGAPKHALLDDYLAAGFAASSAAITSAAFADLFNAYRFLHRVVLVLARTKASFGDLQWLRRTQPQTAVLDFATLPLVYDDTAPAVASIDSLLDLARFMELHHAFSTPDLSLLDMLDRVISDAGYTNDLFAADVETLTTWPAADVEALTAANAITAAYPAAYAHVAAWDRLVRCFDLLMRINGGAANGLALAAGTMTVPVSQTLKQLLRGKYEVDQWLDISKSVQDLLRHRKRDSLVAYLLTKPMPADAPSHKWENANDLYAYYLIDVEMCACMQTSRIVQATNSVQLYVQRCFMGLEPKVRVSVDDDDAWKQWTWMKNYRVWEANRRVFVYPENYALPELKLDRSEIFRKLENELLQNDVTKDNVETAFLNYLQALDEVAQLEIAGTYYQENTHTLHVFGRTAGSEPHTYYYRQFIDSRRWTPWSKVECDIKSDYLVPLVANERLHLVWPEFREEPDEQGSVNVPNQGDTNVALDKPTKKMDVYLAVSEFRSGKWTPKKVAQEPASAGVGYQDTFDKSPYIIIPVDLTLLGGPFLLMVYNGRSYYGGALFELAGCKGYPEPYQGNLPLIPLLTRFNRDEMSYIKNIEDPAQNNQQGDTLVPAMSLALTQKILEATPGLFRISYPQYMSFFDQLYFVILAVIMQQIGWGQGILGVPRGYYLTLGTFYDWFYADKLRTFFVQQEIVAPNGTRYYYQDLVAFTKELLHLMVEGQGQQALQMLQNSASSGFTFELLFNNFYHPLTCHITKQLYAKGVDGMMARETQFADKHFDFHGIYHPTAYVDPQYPQEVIDFTAGTAYSQYNWELFYFAPLMVANRLSANQQFEDAMHWYHYIFDPTGGHDKDPVTHATAPAPQKYWITKPFYQRQAADYEAQRIQNLMDMLASNVGPGTPPPLVKELQDHIADWRSNPFDPHIVAEFRTVAYQKLAVMKYIDNLIAWGDQQFSQFTMESVNQATQLYVLAAEILGPRPHKVPPPATPTPETFNEIEDKLDAFSNAMVELENLVPVASSTPVGSSLSAWGQTTAPVPSLLYFCIPQNDQLVAYWDRVEDRLYKIRHCLDIDGVPRSLALFAPPIDPMALIRALAGGADLASAIAGLDAPLPHYRFSLTLQKANEFNNDVKALGAALLAALEKKDAEALVRLRQTHELSVLNATRAVKQAQIDEQTRALEGLQKNREMVTLRRDYYASRPFISPGEGAAIGLNTASLVVHGIGAVADVLGGVLAVIPDFQLGASGFGGTPHASAKTGGQSFSKAAELAARALYQTSTLMDKTASIASTLAGYQRRMDDWQHQLALANKELEQMDKQIAAAQIRIDNANRELANHDLQISNSKEIDALFHDKYTNLELYDWMRGQIAQTYFQSYQLAFDLAKRAERCFQFELGIENTSYIQFGYWDSLKSGLQAGEHLQLALRQLESAHMDANRREYECTKHVSLALANPLALLKLKDTGSCVVDVPEELFDLDYPGHYFRRLKSVSLSIPCVAGPHTTINCTLRLIRNMVRVNSLAGAQYEHNNDNGVFTDDNRFRESHIRVNAIATSTGQNDNGMFEMNFRDERYLPFEGAGAVSSWQLEMVADRSLRQFDYDTISDVILHLRYTSREDAGQFKEDAVTHLQSVLQNTDPTMKLRRMFDLRREFATEWYAFLHPAPGGDKTLTIQLTRNHFPALGKPDATIQVEAISLAVQTKANDEMKAQLHPPLGGAVADQLTLAAAAHTGDFRTVTKKNIGDDLDETVPWNIRLRKSALTFNDLGDKEVEECFLVVEYTLH